MGVRGFVEKGKNYIYLQVNHVAEASLLVLLDLGLAIR